MVHEASAGGERNRAFRQNMVDRGQGRSGGRFFAILLSCLSIAILATVLLANDFRNLNRLLASFDLPPFEFDVGSAPQPQDIRGDRIPRPRVEIPEHLISRFVPVETRFVRTIRRPPQELCEALRRSGFASSDWKEGGLSQGSWECTSYREFPHEQDGEGPPTSAFLSVRGSREARITSFRIKLNIENPATQRPLTDAVTEALEAFLEEVRWNEVPEIFDNIRSLREFDITRFGNRIQLKKEFGDTPRYNFLITPDRTRHRDSPLPDYFNRELWLPLPEHLRDRA